MPFSEQVITLAHNEVGYLEKKSKACLDSKTANAGSKNYTKYNRDYVAWGCGGGQPMQWCGAFVSWLFAKAYGLEEAKRLLCGGLFHYTPTGANRFRAKGQYIPRGTGMPQAGDVVFFYSDSKKRICHVGLVYKANATRIYTIEGNTSGANALITNGGGVKKKSYKLKSAYIDGYGRPAYSREETKQEEADVIIKTLRKGDKQACVKALQILLIGYGYHCGAAGADGDFGGDTQRSVKAYQKDKGLQADGIVGPKTWGALLAVQ